MGIRILSNIDLNNSATGTQTGTVGEPTVAASGKTLFVTGNWFASLSKDAGATWKLIDPFAEVPPAAGGFCCDQLSLFSRTLKCFVWVLQYSKTQNTNVLRVAVSKTAEPGSWQWWDFAPANLDSQWRNLWFDYPDIAESDGAVWLTTNVFDTNNQWKRAVVLKLDSSTMSSGSTLQYSFWSTTRNGSLRLAQGAGKTMYFGSLNGNGSLRVFEWKDALQTVSHWDVPVAPWGAGAFSSTGPGGPNWLRRCDNRITGAWLVGNQLGFLWTSSTIAQRPHHFVRSARVNVVSRKLIDQPDLWSKDHAIAYPAAAPNSNGVVGLTAIIGGGTLHPSHLVGVRDDANGRWDVAIAKAGTHSPSDGKWGDYLTAKMHATRPTTWVASGYTLQGGTSRADVEPRVVHFSP